MLTKRTWQAGRGHGDAAVGPAAADMLTKRTWQAGRGHGGAAVGPAAADKLNKRTWQAGRGHDGAAVGPAAAVADGGVVPRLPGTGGAAAHHTAPEMAAPSTWGPRPIFFVGSSSLIKAIVLKTVFTKIEQIC